MSKQTRKCQWCGEEFAKWRGRICGACENRTQDTDLYALLASDRSEIVSIHEDITEAQAILKAEAADGVFDLILRKVTGQSGARSQCVDPSDRMDPRERVEAIDDFYRSVT